MAYTTIHALYAVEYLKYSAKFDEISGHCYRMLRAICINRTIASFHSDDFRFYLCLHSLGSLMIAHGFGAPTRCCDLFCQVLFSMKCHLFYWLILCLALFCCYRPDCQSPDSASTHSRRPRWQHFPPGTMWCWSSC